MDAKIIDTGDIEEHAAGRERIAPGQVVVHERQAAVAVNIIEPGRTGAVMTTGVIRVRKPEGVSGFKHGDACDWNMAGHCIAPDGDVTLGTVIGDVARADTVTDVMLNGGVENKKNKPQRRGDAEKGTTNRARIKTEPAKCRTRKGEFI